MKKIKLLVSSALLIPITAAPIVTSCSCSGDNDTKNMINLFNSVFNNDPVLIAQATDANDAISKYEKNILNSEQSRKNEVLFACFNYACKQGLTINGTACTPNNKSFLDLNNDGTIQFGSAYNINVNEIKENKFSFQIQAWMNCVYTKDVDNFKAGDYVQFTYDVEANVSAEIVANTSEAGKFIMDVQYTFDNNELEKVYGFIKYKIGGEYHQTLAINNMKDVNYSKGQWGFNRGCYLDSGV